MKSIGLKETNLAVCVDEAQHGRIVITRKGKPVALVVGVAGLDPEQVELGSSPDFWQLIAKRRVQRTITRAQLEGKLAQASRSKSTAAEHGIAPDVVARKNRSRRRG